MDFFDLNTMIIGFIAIGIFLLILYRRIEFSRYVPGLVCLTLVFIAEVFENDHYELFLDFLENAGILLGSILLVIAALLDYLKSNPKRVEVNDY